MNEPKPQPRDIMSETPRVDALLNWIWSEPHDPTYYVPPKMIDLARQLERDLVQFGTNLCVMCDSKNIDRQRTKTVCRDCGTVSTDNPQSQHALIDHLKTELTQAQARCAEVEKDAARLREALVCALPEIAVCAIPEILEQARAAIKAQR